MGGDMMTLLKYAKEDFSKTLMKSIIYNSDIVKEISLKNMLSAIKKMKDIKEQNMNKIPEWYMNMLIYIVLTIFFVLLYYFLIYNHNDLM